jgi:hypothetical protein
MFARVRARLPHVSAIRLVCIIALTTSAIIISSCTNPLRRQYEYEEQLYLSVDGSATVVVDASLPSLVLLRGAQIDPSLTGSTDRASIRRLYEAAGCPVDSVSRLWERHGRRFAQIQVSVKDLASLPACPLLAWSTYSLTPHPNDTQQLKYVQKLSPAAGRDPGPVNWDGSELVAFKVHAPSRIRFHNVKNLDGTDGSFERGNILTWEQTFADRRAGRPLMMEIDMERTSILYTTLWLFGGAFVAAVIVLVTLVWLTIRRGRKQSRLSAPQA